MPKTYAHETDISNVRHPVPLVDPVNRIILVTNGKCGGTTLKHVFFRNAGLQPFNFRVHELSLDFGPIFTARYCMRAWKRRHLTELAPHLETRDLTAFYRRRYSAGHFEAAAAAGYAVLMVCRNPHHRAASAFDDKFCGADVDKSFVQEMVKEAGADGDITFNQFLTYLARTPDKAHNGHWRRQTYVVDGLTVDHFIRIEHLAQDLEAVNHVFPAASFAEGVHFQRNIYAQEESPYPSDVTDIPASEIRRIKSETGVSPPKNAYLTSRTKETLRQIYCEDFKRLPY